MKLIRVGCALAFAAMAMIGVNAAAAQDVYKVNYFDNNVPPSVNDPHFVGLLPDGKVRIDNPGLTYGNLCAMIYVFDADQQMSECCGCIETHNGLRRLSVNVDLTLHALTGKISNSGVLKVVSAAVNGAGSSCDPSSNVTPKANLRVWVTHVQDLAIMDNYANLLKTIPDSLSFFIRKLKQNHLTRPWVRQSLRICKLNAHSSMCLGAVAAFAAAVRGIEPQRDAWSYVTTLPLRI